MLLWAGFLAIPSLYSQIRIRPRPYIGIGMRIVYHPVIPSFQIDDDFDAGYHEMNIASPKKFFYAGQARLNLLEMWDLALGYTFWGHYHHYSEETPEGLIKLDKEFPHSYSLSFHGATLQWNLNYRTISSKRAMPFLLGGAGTYYGGYKNYYYRTESISGDYVDFSRVVRRVSEYEGWGFMFGGGLVLYRYAYFYAGYMELRGELLARRFIEVYIGFTI